MKIRFGYVSNSSSSSFILADKKLAIEYSHNNYNISSLSEIIQMILDNCEFIRLLYNISNSCETLTSDTKFINDKEYVQRITANGNNILDDSCIFPLSLKENYMKFRSEAKNINYKCIDDFAKLCNITIINLIMTYNKNFPVEFYNISAEDDGSTDPSEDQLIDIFESYDGWKMLQNNH